MTSSPSQHSAPGVLAARPLDGNRGRPVATRPTQSETEAAIRTLIAWLGDDPDRTDLQGTPARVGDRVLRPVHRLSDRSGRRAQTQPDARAKPAVSW